MVQIEVALDRESGQARQSRRRARVELVVRAIVQNLESIKQAEAEMFDRARDHTGSKSFQSLCGF